MGLSPAANPSLDVPPSPARRALLYLAIGLILFGTVGTIVEIIPQIEALLLALAGRGYAYLAFGIVGGLLLFYARRKPAGATGSPAPPH